VFPFSGAMASVFGLVLLLLDQALVPAFLLIEQWIFLARAYYRLLFLPLVLLLIFSGKNLSFSFSCFVRSPVWFSTEFTAQVFCRRPATWLIGPSHLLPALAE
jgi:hypothetical protein